MYIQLCRTCVRWSLRRWSSELAPRYQANDLFVRTSSTSSTFQTNPILSAQSSTSGSNDEFSPYSSTGLSTPNGKINPPIDLSGAFEDLVDEADESGSDTNVDYEEYKGQTIPLNPISGYGRSYIGKDAFYVGMFQNGERHGGGTIVSNIEERKDFKGQFLNGRVISGKGYYMYDNGDAFDGAFVNGHMWGAGELTRVDGTTYVSRWLGGRMTAPCTVRYPSGEAFTGAPTTPAPPKTGYGWHLSEAGAVYEGRWERGLYHGQGTLFNPNGGFLRGHWARGKLQGRGVFVNRRGDVRTGVWEDSGKIRWDRRLPHPSHLSVLTEPEAPLQVRYHADGTSYYGEMLDGMRHGHGVLTFVDGNVYEGRFWQHRMQGFGSHTNIKTGVVYTGHFEDGVKHGTGQITFATGEAFVGTFQHGHVSSGEGTFVYRDLSSYTGALQGGMRQGPGILTEPDGSSLAIAFVNNLAHGEGVHTDAAGERRREVWEMGVLVKQGPRSSDNMKKEKKSARISESSTTSIRSDSESTTPDAANLSTSTSTNASSAAEPLPGVNVAVTLHFEDDSVFTGACLRGVPHGQGRVKYPDGGEYVGHFRQGRKHGLGKQHYKTLRCVYEGEWARGNKHGAGALHYYDTDETFTGEFKDGAVHHGEGVYYTTSDVKYEGVFEHGFLTQGKVGYADGSVYEGALCDGVHHGRGKLTNSEGLVEHDGLWDEGNPLIE